MMILDLAYHKIRLTETDFEAYKTVPALGNFDGVHIGHKALLEMTVAYAKELHAQPSVWTFKEHPFREHVRLLTGNDEKLALFASCGIRFVFLEDFSAVRDMTTAEFAASVLSARCHAVGVVCGFNFHSGKGGVDDAQALSDILAQKNIPLLISKPVLYEGLPCSSTRIRAFLESGDIPAANRCLGRPFSMELPVEHGKELGRILGFPTVNQIPPDGRQLPRRGTYATAVTLDGIRYPAVTNIGTRPTISEHDDHSPNAETHIIGYKGWLYGKNVRVEFRYRLRDEMKFDSQEMLRRQIQRDVEASAADFRKNTCYEEGGKKICADPI